MKRFLVATCLAMAALSAGGCAIIIGDSAPPPVPCPPGPASAGARAEIDAVAGLDFDSSRLSGFKAIAARPGLTPPDQAYLVDAVYRRMDFESSKLAVLLELIKNRSFSEQGKAAILNGFGGLDFESTPPPPNTSGKTAMVPAAFSPRFSATLNWRRCLKISCCE